MESTVITRGTILVGLSGTGTDGDEYSVRQLYRAVRDFTYAEASQLLKHPKRVRDCEERFEILVRAGLIELTPEEWETFPIQEI